MFHSEKTRGFAAIENSHHHGEDCNRSERRAVGIEEAVHRIGR